jgi:MSHA biogenesis protein MshM
MMYTEHFGLTELPFGLTPDTSFLFSSAQSRHALNTLLVAVKSSEGFIKITGEVGTGKTLLCRKFMTMLDDGFVTAYIPNPFLEPRTLLLALADELGIVLEKDIDQHHLLKAINFGLLLLAGEGKRVLLCLDEAQAAPMETLEVVRLLTNLETEKRKLLQIVLFGQPELNRILELESFRQFTQRITFHYHIAPLSRADVDDYVSHRMRVAGFMGSRLFSRAAIGRLYATSGGIPRLVNIMAHKALMLSYGEGKQQVTWRHVHVAARDTLASKRLGTKLSKSINKHLNWSSMTVPAMMCAVAALTWVLTK